VGGVVLCFTGGVDSFYTLLRSDLRPEALCWVHGYDVPLAEHERGRALEARLRSVAATVDTRPVLVSSNLRVHPAFHGSDWERAHGGALAAVGHLLSEAFGTLAISSTFDYRDERPWGSHWRTDRLWSSSRMQIAHWGAQITRDEKLRQIADEPLVRENLRVCWQEGLTQLNCSRCDKCVVTMVTLRNCGKLEAFGVFDEIGDLAGRLDDQEATRYLRTYASLQESCPEPGLRRAIERLLVRSA
jgi:hypothetical protein